jgi:hypothetical protein
MKFWESESRSGHGAMSRSEKAEEAKTHGLRLAQDLKKYLGGAHVKYFAEVISAKNSGKYLSHHQILMKVKAEDMRKTRARRGRQQSDLFFFTSFLGFFQYAL